MEAIHRVSIRGGQDELRDLATLGISPNGPPTNLPGGGALLIGFDASESLPNWPEIRDWALKHNATHTIETRFDKGEVHSADWGRLQPSWHHGYPEPDPGTSGYLTATYDLEDYCYECGVGRRQVAPFQMKGEPRWGRRNILQLNWIFDEYFVTPDLWSVLFEPHGVERFPVLGPAGNQLTSVVQLVIDHTVDLQTDGLRFEVCPACGRTKYLPIVRGMLPPLAAEPPGAIARSRQYFGSGASGFHEVVGSRSLVHEFQTQAARGAFFEPVSRSKLPEPWRSSWRPLAEDS